MHNITRVSFDEKEAQREQKYLARSRVGRIGVYQAAGTQQTHNGGACVTAVLKWRLADRLLFWIRLA